MISHLRLVLCVVALMSLAGCANWDSIYHEFGPKDNRTIAVDAKQRFLVMGTRNGYTVTGTAKDGSQQTSVVPNQIVDCSEPSPDTFSVIGASFKGNAQVQGKLLDAALGTSESGSTIGTRTQTIQILRDAMYRLCEGYLSGALSPNAFERLQRRYQNAMLGFLAIEQLSGVVVPKQTSVSATAPNVDGGISATSAEGSASAPGSQTSERASAPSASASSASAPVGGSSSPSSSASSAASLGVSKTSSSGTLASANSVVDASSSAQSGTSSNGFARGQISDPLGKVVAGVVKDIVFEILHTDYSKETCLNYLVDGSNGTPLDLDVVAYCKQSLNEKSP